MCNPDLAGPIEGGVVCSLLVPMHSGSAAVQNPLRLVVAGFSEQWLVSEATVPEAAWYDRALSVLRDQLVLGLRRAERDAIVYRDLAIRVRQDRPQVGFDPDLCVVEPRPPGAEDLDSLCLWRRGHVPPRLSIEVVSPGHPYKDYVDIPARCAAAGVEELVVFDPRLAGPASLGGPHLLQVWRRGADGAFERTSAGGHAVRSEVIGAWLIPEHRGVLRLSEDAEGRALWRTPEQAQADRAEAERDRAEAALARVAELERVLADRRG